MPAKKLFVERRPEGDYAARLPNSKRASLVKPTQGEAIQATKQMHPDASVVAERVRHVPGGSPDKWRKV